jgi:hypothetical protein
MFLVEVPTNSDGDPVDSGWVISKNNDGVLANVNFVERPNSLEFDAAGSFRF